MRGFFRVDWNEMECDLPWLLSLAVLHFFSNCPECGFSDVLLRENQSRKMNASREAPHRTGRRANAA